MTRGTPLAIARLDGSCRRVAATALMASAVGAVGATAAPARGIDARTLTPQPLAVLVRDHVVQTGPNPHARRVGRVAALRPLTGVRTVLPVLGRATSRDGKHWIRVLLPGRPDGHSGWIAAHATRPATTGWRLALDLSARRLTVYLDGHIARRFAAVVGKPSTPTPRGRFFVEEALSIAGQAGGPYALATSARSNVLQQFEGGPGQIAIHGTDRLVAAPGTAASHGCIRLSTPDITWLAGRIGGGVPLTISA